MSTTIADNAFGRFLKFWRKVHDINQEALAFKLNSSARILVDWKTAIVEPANH